MKKYNQCEKCGSKFLNYDEQLTTIKRSGIDTLTAVILLFFPVVGWIALIYLCTRKQVDSNIIAICTDCGYKKNITKAQHKQKSKSTKNIVIAIIIIMILFFIGVNFYLQNTI